MQNCGKEALITMFKDSSLPFGIIRVELDETGRPADWIFLCCNQALETLTGRTRAELLSNSFLTLRPDGASEWMGPFYTAAFEKSPARLEVRDETRKFHLYIDCLPIDEAGECALLLRNSWKEDTYRKKLEEQIVSFRNIHKSMSSGAWHLTFNDRWERVSVEWSDTLRQMLGFRSEKEFPNAFEAWTRQLHPEDEARVLSAYEAVVEDTTGEQPFDVEYRLRHKDGTYHWFHTTGGLSRRADGSPEFFDGIFVNTDEKHETREHFQRALREAQTARQEAEFLQKIGCSVTYFDRPKQCEIRGDGRVESVTCDGRTIPAEGVFILRPTMAPTELFPGLAVEQGYVTVDRRIATNLPGLFAAGDCTGGPLQVSKAAGDGLIAGQSAAAWAAAQERREKQS